MTVSHFWPWSRSTQARWLCVSLWHACEDEYITNTHSYAGCEVPMVHFLYRRCVCIFLHLSALLSVCVMWLKIMLQTWPRHPFFNFFFFDLTVPEYVRGGVSPFSALASRCMSGNHTRHWGGGSDISVSRNVLRETFFCSAEGSEINRTKSPTT